MESDREFGANHAWNPRERVIVRCRTTLHEVRGSWWRLRSWRHTCCVQDVTGNINVLAKNACHQEGPRRFASVKRIEGHMVADVRQNSILRENTGNGLQGALGDHHVNMKQREMLATMKRMQKLMSGASEEIREKLVGLGRQDLGPEKEKT